MEPTVEFVTEAPRSVVSVLARLLGISCMPEQDGGFTRFFLSGKDAPRMSDTLQEAGFSVRLRYTAACGCDDVRDYQ